MKLSDVVSGPWAITPEMLIEIQGIYARHIKGETVDLASLAARIGKPLSGGNKSISSTVNGVTVIDIQGAIAKKINILSDVSGGCSSQLVSAVFTNAVNDPAVKGIIINIDSPGGTVDGTSELADSIYQARGAKPVVAFSDGMIASAAYWIASACDSIYISGDTNPIGSIGVVSAHRDYSGYESQQGIKVTEITAGSYKRVASSHEPLNTEGKADIQSKVDFLYGVFVDAVARNRGTSSRRVLADMADGRVFLGKQSIKAGLVDGVSTLPKIIADMQAGQVKHRPVAQVIARQPVISNAAFTTILALKDIKPAQAPPAKEDPAERQRIIAMIADGAGTH